MTLVIKLKASSLEKSQSLIYKKILNDEIKKKKKSNHTKQL